MKYILIMALLLSSLYATSKVEPAPVKHYNSKFYTNNHTIHNKGIGGVIVGISTTRDMLKEFGTDFVTINNNDYTIEFFYEKTGLSFSYLVGDKRQIIAYASALSGTTEDGITIGKDTIESASKKVKLKGWSTGNGSKFWSQNIYQILCNVDYSILRNLSVPQYPFNEELHKNKKIVKITISANHL